MTPSALHLNLATWIPCTCAEGPGRRFALWVQGCPLHCPGCCNPEMLPDLPRLLVPITEALQWILDAQQRHNIEGITCLGGEPFFQAEALAALCTQVRQRGLSVMIFSGYTLAILQQNPHPACQSLLAASDLLVDGPYLQALHTTQRRWIGSTNQQVHFLSPRYQPTDPCWNEPNSLEIHFNGKELLISGFPEPRWLDQLRPLQRALAKD